MNSNFKKIVNKLVIILILSSSFNLSAQDITPGVISLSQSGNSIIIDFQLPEYSIENINIYEEYGINQYYSNINIDNFGQLYDEGYPALPQLTIDLHIPEDATTFNVSTSNMQTETKYLSYKIIPTQEEEEDEIPQFVINNNYYQSSGNPYTFTHQVSEPYMLMTAQGISFSIFPFQYNPSQNKVTVIKSMRFILTHNGTTSTLKSGTIASGVDNYLSKVFCNYSRLKSGSTDKGDYLIITPSTYSNTLTYFANYKRNLGYNVTVVTTSTTGTTSGDIKNYIQTQYNNSTTRPEYVLLVGDIGDIPASGGTEGDYKDPLTDLNYARLSGDDYFADVFLGRWSISTIDELQNIINKTIFMESNLHRFTKRALLLSGGINDKWPHNEDNNYDNSMRWVMDNALNPNGFERDFLFRVDGKTRADAISALNNNYTWFFYRGHGAVRTIDVDGSVSYDDGDFNLNGNDIDASTSQLYPMAFVFSCNSGNYGNSSICFGERWIRSEKGGVSFLGATTTTRRHVNNVIIKKMFGDAFTDEEQLGPMVNLGMKRYWKRFWSFFSRKKTKRHMKSYNFHGDPSFNKSGNGCITDFVFDNNEIFHSGDSLTYQASNNIENNSSFVLNSGSSVTLIAGNSIKLNPGFKAEVGSTFKAYTAPCTNTTILKSGKVQDKNIETTLFIDSIKTASLDLDVIAYPNPFKDNLSIRFCLNEDEKVSISITNQLGVKVLTHIKPTIFSKGVYYEPIPTSDLPTGFYFYEVTVGSQKHIGKILKL